MEVRLLLAAPRPGAMDDEHFMRAALEEARRAEAAGEVPVGAVIVVDGVIVARAHNLRESTQDPTAHAEMLALRQAAAAVGSFRLTGATCYVTLEPCPMCAGALVLARVARVVWGADDPKAGALRTLYEIGSDARLNHRFETRAGVLAEACGRLLSDFFRAIRARGRGAAPDGGGC
ncbi:MAG: tRNA adenosine(34) deaminase TadA [Myxococcales bacterium]|nr:tRNA adenosine(34) deaminase TadA [Myxococcales bacterium]